MNPTLLVALLTLQAIIGVTAILTSYKLFGDIEGITLIFLVTQFIYIYFAEDIFVPLLATVI